MTPAKKSTRGRNALSEHVKARRRVVKAYQQLQEANKELDYESGLKDEQKGSPRYKALQKALKDRMATIEPLEIAITRAYALQWKKERTPAEERELEAIKAERSALYEELANKPELGATHEEWNDPAIYPPALKSKRLGRPKLTADQKVFRAQIALNDAMAEKEAEEKKAGSKIMTLNEVLAAEANNKDSNSGRRSMSGIDKLERDIARLENLREAALEDLRNYNPDDPEFARMRKHPAEKARELKSKIDAKQRQVIELEDELDNVERIYRHLKKLRKQARKVASAQGPRAKSSNELAALEQQIDEYKRYRVYIERKAAGDNPRIPHALGADAMDKMYEEIIRNDDDGELFHRGWEQHPSRRKTKDAISAMESQL